jgi:abortive infection bacteriophage resistance protein
MFGIGGDVKRARTLDEMLDLLESRGLALGDRDVAGRFLYNENYYRLSGYFRQFQVDPRNGEDNFEPTAELADIRAAYDYNERLTGLLIPALARLERVVRARFAYHVAQHRGHLASYLNEAAFLSAMPDRTAFLDRTSSELLRSKSPMVRRYVRGEDLSELPIWVAVEVLPFGTVSKMLEYFADTTEARETAHSLSLRWETFASTVHSLAVLRNRCAHHGQLWHRRLDLATPVLPTERRHEPPFDPQGPYPAILAVKRILGKIDPADPRKRAIEDFFLSEKGLAQGIYFPAPR